MKTILDTLNYSCEENDLHCFAIIGNEDSYDVLRVGDYSEIGETLYFALCRNKKLLKTVKSAVEVASSLLEKSND